MVYLELNAIMSQNKKKHDPSFYRGLIREQKSEKGRHPKKLLGEARTIQDPYYASLALFRLSDDPRVPISEAKLVAREAVRLASEEKRVWRRAELYGKLAKYAKTWNEEFSNEDSDYFLDLLLDTIKDLPNGKGLSQNLNEISKHIGCIRLPALLKIAVNNTDFMLDDSKTVIRQWATECNNCISPNEIYTVLSTVQDSFLQSKLMGYLYLQCNKNQIEFPKAFQKALENAKNVQGKNNVEALRYLSRHIQIKKDFLSLKKVIFSLSHPSDRVQLLTTLAGSADKKNHFDFSFNTFAEALDESKQIKQIEKRTKEQIKIAKGFIKIGKNDLGKEILVKNHESIDNRSIKKSIEQTMQESNMKFDDIQPVQKDKKTSHYTPSSLPASTGKTLGLYDTYEGAIKPIHIRTIARAAPLCAAFGLDLALMGFPIKNLKDFIKQATTDTTIGEGGKYLQFLFDENRIHTYPCSQKKPPNFTNNELAVATTAHPDENKTISVTEAFIKKGTNPRKRLIFIMGLGKKGLPSTLLKRLDYHLELTGNQVSLETCTAMGIIAMKMYEQKR